MKHIVKRLISTLLLGSMLLATACSGGAGEETTAAAVTTTAAETVDEGPKLEIPDTLKFPDETVTILTAEGIVAGPDELEEGATAQGEAAYNWRRTIEEMFGITLESIGIVPWGDTQNLARQSINAGSDDYDMVFTCAQHQVNLVNEGLYLPLNSLPYIDIEKPWWNKQYIDSVSVIEGEPYILFGDITYNTTQRTTCVFFNINLLEEKLNMVPDDLYQLVYDGEWTIEKFGELVSMVYEDANGNTKNDPDDIHGLVTNGNGAFNWMAFSSGLEFTTRDELGYPVLDINKESTISLIDKLGKVFWRNPSVGNVGDNHEHVWKFGNGNALFLVNRFFLTGWEQLRTMEDDYGILPMPKYDESIDGYHSTVEILVQWGAVPVTVPEDQIEMVSAVAEAMAYYGREYITPAYYETTLKLKQTRDEASMDMIDMIMAGRDTDFLFVNSLSGLNTIFSSIAGAGNNIFASIYAAKESAAKANLETLIETFENNRSY